MTISLPDQLDSDTRLEVEAGTDLLSLTVVQGGASVATVVLDPPDGRLVVNAVCWWARGARDVVLDASFEAADFADPGLDPLQVAAERRGRLPRVLHLSWNRATYVAVETALDGELVGSLSTDLSTDLRGAQSTLAHVDRRLNSAARGQAVVVQVEITSGQLAALARAVGYALQDEPYGEPGFNRLFDVLATLRTALADE